MVEEKVFGEYGRKKLLMYADSFLDLANSFAETEQAEAGNMPSEGREKMLKEHSFRESMQVLLPRLKRPSKNSGRWRNEKEIVRFWTGIAADLESRIDHHIGGMRLAGMAVLAAAERVGRCGV